jgi:hypothetical protein
MPNPNSQVISSVYTVEEPRACPLNIKILNCNIKLFKPAMKAYFLLSCSVADIFN